MARFKVFVISVFCYELFYIVMTTKGSMAYGETLLSFNKRHKRNMADLFLSKRFLLCFLLIFGKEEKMKIKILMLLLYISAHTYLEKAQDLV